MLLHLLHNILTRTSRQGGASLFHWVSALLPRMAYATWCAATPGALFLLPLSPTLPDMGHSPIGVTRDIFYSVELLNNVWAGISTNVVSCSGRVSARRFRFRGIPVFDVPCSRGLYYMHMHAPTCLHLPAQLKEGGFILHHLLRTIYMLIPNSGIAPRQAVLPVRCWTCVALHLPHITTHCYPFWILTTCGTGRQPCCSPLPAYRPTANSPIPGLCALSPDLSYVTWIYTPGPCACNLPALNPPHHLRQTMPQTVSYRTVVSSPWDGGERKPDVGMDQEGISGHLYSGSARANGDYELGRHWTSGGTSLSFLSCTYLSVSAANFPLPLLCLEQTMCGLPLLCLSHGNMGQRLSPFHLSCWIALAPWCLASARSALAALHAQQALLLHCGQTLI